MAHEVDDAHANLLAAPHDAADDAVVLVRHDARRPLLHLDVRADQGRQLLCAAVPSDGAQVSRHVQAETSAGTQRLAKGISLKLRGRLSAAAAARGSGAATLLSTAGAQSGAASRATACVRSSCAASEASISSSAWESSNAVSSVSLKSSTQHTFCSDMTRNQRILRKNRQKQHCHVSCCLVPGESAGMLCMSTVACISSPSALRGIEFASLCCSRAIVRAIVCIAHGLAG